MSGMDTPRQPLVDLDRSEADLAGLGLRERKKRLRLRRIVHAAETLFMDKGFTNTTIQDIADRAEVGLGTLYL
ncbi:MAG: helix-turn-helix domain-containing protein, partial [Pseudomonadota bacterium]